MSHPTLFITGTDTAVGKTVLTGLLARHLRRAGWRVAALKPLCAGGREDALALGDAMGWSLPLNEVNPWHFRAPLAPVLAARQERRPLRMRAVLAQLRAIRCRFEVVLIEGAGGLLSPLGEDFNARDLIAALRATPLVVCPNRLGAVNQALLVVNALPTGAAGRAQVVLVDPPQADLASRANRALLAECLGAQRVHRLPWQRSRGAQASTTRVLRALCRAVLSALTRH